MTTRILIADDEVLARSRLCRLLDKLAEYEIIGEAASGSEALQMSLDTLRFEKRMGVHHHSVEIQTRRTP